MKILIESTFTPRTHSLINIHEGRNIVKKAPWMKDLYNDGWSVCYSTTMWSAPAGYIVSGMAEDYEGNLIFSVFKDKLIQ